MGCVWRVALPHPEVKAYSARVEPTSQPAGSRHGGQLVGWPLNRPRKNSAIAAWFERASVGHDWAALEAQSAARRRGVGGADA